jgi:hypothetical protein
MTEGDFKQLTVVSLREPAGTELLLEPDGNPTAKKKKIRETLFEQEVPLTAFGVDDIQKE